MRLAANRGSPTVVQAMRPRRGKANGGTMSKNDEKTFEIVFEVPPSPEGTYRHEREDGTVVHGDASGAWTLDDDGEVEDIIFFMSPLHLMKLRQRGLLEPEG
jgi:hypothetical protein